MFVLLCHRQTFIDLALIVWVLLQKNLHTFAFRNQIWCSCLLWIWQQTIKCKEYKKCHRISVFVVTTFFDTTLFEKIKKITKQLPTTSKVNLQWFTKISIKSKYCEIETISWTFFNEKNENKWHCFMWLYECVKWNLISELCIFLG